MNMSKRLMIEASEMKSRPPENCSAGPYNDNLMLWKAMIIGPKASPFEGGIFNLTIKIPQTYPYKPPEIKFDTQVYHPNIDKKGNICLDILKDQWSPALSVSKVLLSICSLLTDPNPEDPLVPEVAALYKENKKKYESIAKEWTMKYATGTTTISAKKVPKYETNEDDEESDEETDEDEETDDEM